MVELIIDKMHDPRFLAMLFAAVAAMAANTTIKVRVLRELAIKSSIVALFASSRSRS
jgi:hypothetical protein